MYKYVNIVVHGSFLVVLSAVKKVHLNSIKIKGR